MHKLKNPSVTVAVVAFVSVLFLGMLSPLAAKADELGFGQRIAGTYFTDESGDMHRIVTITAEDNWLSIHTDQFGVAFSNQQGTWKKTDKRDVTVETLDIGYHPTTGMVTGFTRVRYALRFDSDFKTFSGTFTVTSFAADQDPLDDEGMVVATDRPITGRRLIVK